MEGEHQRLFWFCLIFQEKIHCEDSRIHKSWHLFIRGTQSTLMKVLFVVISRNMLIQAGRDHEEWVGTYSMLSTCSPLQPGNAVLDMHGSLLR